MLFIKLIITIILKNVIKISQYDKEFQKVFISRYVIKINFNITKNKNHQD